MLFDYKYKDTGDGISKNNIIIFESDAKETQLVNAPLSIASTNWTEMAVDFNSGNNDEVFFQMARWTNTSKGELYLDDFQIEKKQAMVIFDVSSEFTITKTSKGLDLKCYEMIKSIELYSLSGLKVLHREVKSKQTSLNNIKSGLYLIKINFSSESICTQIIL